MRRLGKKRLKEIGLDRLEDAYWLEDSQVERILGTDTTQWSVARYSLPQDQQGLEQLKERLLERIGDQFPAGKWSFSKGSLNYIFINFVFVCVSTPTWQTLMELLDYSERFVGIVAGIRRCSDGFQRGAASFVTCA